MTTYKDTRNQIVVLENRIKGFEELVIIYAKKDKLDKAIALMDHITNLELRVEAMRGSLMFNKNKRIRDDAYFAT